MSNELERWFDRKGLSPFREFSGVQDSFEKLLGEFLSLRRSDGSQSFSFSPTCDIIEDDEGYVLKFDLPGIARDQIKVEADRDRITIHAERREEKRTDEKKKHLSEMCYGWYTRSFNLPGPVDEKKVDARLEDGVLTVAVPKTESVKAKQIPIH